MPEKAWEMDDYPGKIAVQIKAWSEVGIKEKKPFVTISREYGSDGWNLAKKLAERLNNGQKIAPPWLAYNRDVLSRVKEDTQLSTRLAETLEQPAQNAIDEFFDNYFADKPPRIAIFKKTAKTIKTLAWNGNVVLVGRAGCLITRGMENGFHVRIVAPLEFRIETVSKRENLSQKESVELITTRGEDRDAIIKEYFFTNVADAHHYNLVINREYFDLDNATDLIMHSMKIKGLIK